MSVIASTTRGYSTGLMVRSNENIITLEGVNSVADEVPVDDGDSCEHTGVDLSS